MRITDNNSLPGGAGDQSNVNAQHGQEANKSADAKNSREAEESQKAEKAQAARAGIRGASESGHNDRVQLSGLAAALRTETSGSLEREAKIHLPYTRPAVCDGKRIREVRRLAMEGESFCRGLNEWFRPTGDAYTAAGGSREHNLEAALIVQG